jgi:hypothetical protein
VDGVADCSDCEGRLAEANTQVSDCKTQLAAANKKAESLQAKLALVAGGGTSVDLLALQSQLTAAQQGVRTLEREKKELEGRELWRVQHTLALQEERDKLRTQLTDGEPGLVKLQAELAACRTERNACDLLVVETTAELDAARSHAHQLEQKVNTMKPFEVDRAVLDTKQAQLITKMVNRTNFLANTANKETTPAIDRRVIMREFSRTTDPSVAREWLNATEDKAAAVGHAASGAGSAAINAAVGVKDTGAEALAGIQRVAFGAVDSVKFNIEQTRDAIRQLGGEAATLGTGVNRLLPVAE